MNNATNVPYFLSVWNNHVLNDSDKVAVVDGATNNSISRKELDILSSKVYRYLNSHGIGKEDFVMICLPRGIEILVSILGVWKAGAAFTVVEDDYAPDRIEYIRNDVGCKLFLNQAVYDEIIQGEPLPGFVSPEPHDACFAIYTSGTTGFPKGILHEYGNIALNNQSGSRSKRVTEESRYAMVSPMNFVAAIKMFLVMIKTGCTIFIIPYNIIKNPVLLKKYYVEQQISVSFLSPSILRILGDDLGPYLKYVFTGSEPADGIFVKNAELINTYSMSEALSSLASYKITEPSDLVPVGKPNSDKIKLLLLDKHGNPVPVGQIGEIAFENPYMRGYINLPEITSKALRNGIFYTGDLGKMLPDGNLLLLGRKNDMIKINGNRIEPAEIERAFREITSVNWCVAKGFETPSHSFICLFYKDDIDCNEEAIRTKLSSKLPYYMIPSYYVKIDNIPLLPNGKVNKKALLAPNEIEYSTEYIAPTNNIEEMVCNTFSKILGIDKIGIKDDFYKLGGDSLKTMALLAKLGCEHLTASDIFKGCTPKNIASIIASDKADLNLLMENEYAARKGKYKFTATQRYMYSLECDEFKRTTWNLPLAFRINNLDNCEHICSALNKVMENSPIFSTVVTKCDDDSFMMHIDASIYKPVTISDVSSEELKKIQYDFVNFDRDIFNKPLYNIGIYRTFDEAFLYINMAHYITDGSTYQLFFRNLIDAYNNKELPLDTFYTYLKEENEKYYTSEFEESKKYFTDTYANTPWDRALTPDRNDENTAFTDGVIVLPDVTTQKLESFENKSKITRNGLVTLTLLLARAKIDNSKNPIINWIFHNRVDKISKDALGCVCTNLPIGLRLESTHTLKDCFESYLQQSISGIRNAICNSIIDAQLYATIDSSLVVYESLDITQTKQLEDIGLFPSSIENPHIANPKFYAVQVFEQPDMLSFHHIYPGNRYSKNHAEAYQAAVTEIFYKILNCEDYEDTTVAEIISK